ncbi:FixH family protein [Gemmatimonas sp.]|uniref:FixH family protein n=1 Tax=Gemmatimonas sp. TaxID=1962908 RepID=UPI00286CE259|nr:FixH family protein [Gemmatimonas sp.]
MKAGMGWPIGITAILGATVAANLVMMRIANNDPSFSVEPDYYKKAVFYDSTMAQTHRNLDLGWSVQTFADSIVAGKPTRLRVVLRDEKALPLLGATVQATVLFNARANDLTTATLSDEGAGAYTATVPINTPGEWEVRVNAKRDTSHFTSSTRITAVRASVRAAGTGRSR